MQSERDVCNIVFRASTMRPGMMCDYTTNFKLILVLLTELGLTNEIQSIIKSNCPLT